MLKDDKEEFVDAIGDMVVVLTNLAHQRDVHIETCIASAYNEIQNRTGKMINGKLLQNIQEEAENLHLITSSAKLPI